MELIIKKNIEQADHTEEAKIYRLGNGCIVTTEVNGTDKQGKVLSSFTSKHFAPTKRSITLEQNFKRALRYVGYDKKEVKVLAKELIETIGDTETYINKVEETPILNKG